MIKNIENLYFIFGKNGEKLSEGYKTKREAEKRLKQIEFFKRKNMKQRIKIQDSINLSKIDFEITDDNIIIYNVPIAAEIVQEYDDGFAFKPFSEISKIQVDQIPLTIVNYEPNHPKKHLEDMTSKERSDVVVGFMAEPSKLTKEKKDNKKRYADFVIHKTPKTKSLELKLEKGESIDTSIGFTYEQINSPGEYNGLKYDYIQSDIQLDHNALLIDIMGNTGIGRAPNPIAGIGADSKKKRNNGRDIIMTGDEINQLKKENDDLEKNNKMLQKKLDEAEQKIESAEDKAKLAEEIKTDIDNQFKKIKSQDEDLKKKINDLKKELTEYHDERQLRIDEAKQFMSKAYPAMNIILESCDSKILLKQYDEFHKNKPKSRDIGADMMRTPDFDTAKADKTFQNYTHNFGKRGEK